MQAQRSADPWDARIEQALQNEEARALCHHCLTPQDHSGWFCPVCGATVGQYANYLPYVYLFAQGEVLRAGVAEHLRRSPLIVSGYILLSLTFFPVLACLFFVWAPVYWFFFLENILKPRPSTAEDSQIG